MSSRDFDPLTRDHKVKLSRLRRDLLFWFAEHHRDLPWRTPTASTFERICVEVLLQRTRAEAVAGVYCSFFGRFGSWSQIAAAPVEELEAYFKPIGLWKRRARAVRAMAKSAAALDGQFPADIEKLSMIPAVGQYMANAILLFQHGEPRPLLDVNMARIIERFVRPRRMADIRVDPWLQAAAHWLVKGDRSVEVNWAALDFGSAVCTARGPSCAACPVFTRCSSKGAEMH